MHNGEIGGFTAIRRELAMAVAPELYPCIQGATDSEVF
jgi:glutamine amidotransferase